MVGDAVVPEDVAEVPELGDDVVGDVAHESVIAVETAQAGRLRQSASLNVSSTCCKLAVEHAIEPREAAAFALEDQVGVVERVAVDDQVGLGLRGDPLQPLALRVVQLRERKHLLQARVDALLVRHERSPSAAWRM